VTSNVNVYRETIGFEKTLFGDRSSVGLRVPFIQADQGTTAEPDAQRVNAFQFGQVTDTVNEVSNRVNRAQLGDISVILKYALIDDRDTGDILSAGMVVTIPTGDGIPTIEGTLHPTLLQPYLGYLVNFDRALRPRLQFHRGPNRWARRDGHVQRHRRRLLLHARSARWTRERHGAGRRPAPQTPLNHRGTLDNPVGMADSLDATADVTFMLGQRSTLGMAVSVPLTAPRPFDIEGQVQWVHSQRVGIHMMLDLITPQPFVARAV
jgi:hypothetical protein